MPATSLRGELSIGDLLGGPAALASALDVDPRLLVPSVRRPQPVAVAPTKPLLPPVDEVDDIRHERRRALLALTGGLASAAVAVLSVTVALG